MSEQEEKGADPKKLRPYEPFPIFWAKEAPMWLHLLVCIGIIALGYYWVELQHGGVGMDWTEFRDATAEELEIYGYTTEAERLRKADPTSKGFQWSFRKPYVLGAILLAALYDCVIYVLRRSGRRKRHLP